MSFNEKRKATRKNIRHMGWIATPEDGVLQECVLSDVSETGARIDMGSIRELPDEFLLLFTRNAKMRRRCYVMWRKGTQVGVHFDRRYH